jgi:hypothetical protein
MGFCRNLGRAEHIPQISEPFIVTFLADDGSKLFPLLLFRDSSFFLSSSRRLSLLVGAVVCMIVLELLVAACPKN